ncbi:hypothetical protein CYY_005525 [Polysphondylium violaceum]|uniref:BTB domain-containing protein n=1 Tax=Polysphondylium violaceum TaxID=133409 RepID=A0A8J4V435_9MYCE|nr:hypothetical protein CYY_005525 [Polysphondylium violaceum]
MIEKDQIYSDEWVSLNVGGKIFHTTTSTLTSCKTSVLYKMFSKESNLPVSRKDVNNNWLFDRDPEYFRVVLNYLRTLPTTHNDLVIDEGVSLKGVLQEALFFQIDGLVKLIKKIESSQSDFSRKEILLHRSSIKFNNKKLNNLDLSSIEFIKESFNFSNISYSNFDGCKLSLSTFFNVKAKNATFNNTLADNVNYSTSNLKNSQFLKSDLSHSSFNNCDLSYSRYDQSNCTGSLFQRATIVNGSFKNTYLEHAKFQKACLRGCDFTGAMIQNCHFTSADLRNAIFDWKNIPPSGVVFFKKSKITKQQYDQIPLENKDRIGFKILADDAIISPKKQKYINRNTNLIPNVSNSSSNNSNNNNNNNNIVEELPAVLTNTTLNNSTNIAPNNNNNNNTNNNNNM